MTDHEKRVLIAAIRYVEAHGAGTSRESIDLWRAVNELPQPDPIDLRKNA